MIKITPALLLITLSLSACSIFPPPSPIVVMPTIEPPTPEPTALTPSITLRGTSTSHPSRTPTLTNHPQKTPSDLELTRTPIITKTLSLREQNNTVYFATWNIIETKMAEFPFDCDPLNQTGLSPDEYWMQCGNYKTLVLKNKDGQEINLDISEHIPENTVIWINPLRWSKDSQYLWVAIGDTTGGESICMPYQKYLGLFRIDVENKKTTSVLPFYNEGYSILFSPSGRYLSFIKGKSELTIVEIISGERYNIGENDQFSGSMAWSYDESQLAFSTQYNDIFCTDTKLKVFDLTSNEINTIYQSAEMGAISIIEWGNMGEISFITYGLTPGVTTIIKP